MFPTLFISHGAPNFILKESISKNNIKKISSSIKKPNYIIIVSAHYITNDLNVISYEADKLMYDFYGFEKELYEYKYDIKSDKNLTQDLINCLSKNSISCKIDFNRNSYDHGVWTILSTLYKKIDIPVIQLSLPINYSNRDLFDLGEALKELKNDALIICSGGITHNLSDMSLSTTPKKYAIDFNILIKKAIENNNYEELFNIKENHLFNKNHPSSEHFLPLFIALGASFNKRGRSFNSEIQYSNISMESFIFDD